MKVIGNQGRWVAKQRVGDNTEQGTRDIGDSVRMSWKRGRNKQGKVRHYK